MLCYRSGNSVHKSQASFWRTPPLVIPGRQLCQIHVSWGRMRGQGGFYKLNNDFFWLLSDKKNSAVFFPLPNQRYIWYHRPQRVFIKGRFLIFRLPGLFFKVIFWNFDCSCLYFAMLSDNLFVFLTLLSNGIFLLSLGLKIFRLEFPTVIWKKVVWNVFSGDPSAWNLIGDATFFLGELLVAILRPVSVRSYSPKE